MIKRLTVILYGIIGLEAIYTYTEYTSQAAHRNVARYNTRNQVHGWAWHEMQPSLIGSRPPLQISRPLERQIQGRNAGRIQWHEIGAEILALSLEPLSVVSPWTRSRRRQYRRSGDFKFIDKPCSWYLAILGRAPTCQPPWRPADV